MTATSTLQADSAPATRSRSFTRAARAGPRSPPCPRASRAAPRLSSATRSTLSAATARSTRARSTTSRPTRGRRDRTSPRLSIGRRPRRSATRSTCLAGTIPAARAHSTRSTSSTPSRTPGPTARLCPRRFRSARRPSSEITFMFSAGRVTCSSTTWSWIPGRRSRTRRRRVARSGAA